MSTATTMRDLYIAAETAVLLGQSFEIAGRKLSRADLAEIRKGRAEWEQRVRDETAVAAGRKGPLRFAVADFNSGRDQ
jgi:hypothetical protein